MELTAETGCARGPFPPAPARPGPRARRAGPARCRGPRKESKGGRPRRASARSVFPRASVAPRRASRARVAPPRAGRRARPQPPAGAARRGSPGRAGARASPTAVGASRALLRERARLRAAAAPAAAPAAARARAEGGASFTSAAAMHRMAMPMTTGHGRPAARHSQQGNFFKIVFFAHHIFTTTQAKQAETDLSIGAELLLVGNNRRRRNR
jgi:hypothetical protein